MSVAFTLGCRDRHAEVGPGRHDRAGQGRAKQGKRAGENRQSRAGADMTGQGKGAGQRGRAEGQGRAGQGKGPGQKGMEGTWQGMKTATLPR